MAKNTESLSASSQGFINCLAYFLTIAMGKLRKKKNKFVFSGVLPGY
jgi:hypothetical protein